jgi:membrane protein implicated in regulation of membrane protease activity
VHSVALRLVGLYVLLALAVRAAVSQAPGSTLQLLLFGASGVLALVFVWRVLQIPTMPPHLLEDEPFSE